MAHTSGWFDPASMSDQSDTLWRPMAAAAAAVAIPVISSYATERLASGGATPSIRPSDGGSAAAQRLPFRRGVAWQAALAALGAVSWLLWQHFGVLPALAQRSGWGLSHASPFSSWRSQRTRLSTAARILMFWATQPWLAAVLAFLLLCPLLQRNANARLFVSAAGLLAAVEAVHVAYAGDTANALLSPRALRYSALTLLAAALLAYWSRQRLPEQPPQQPRLSSAGSGPSPHRKLQKQPSALQSLSQCLSPSSLIRTGSIFGSGNASAAGVAERPQDGAEDVKDAGHFLVQPSGSFSQPVRSPIGMMLRRVSGLLLGQGPPPAPPQPPRPWLDDAHRSIDSAFWAEPGSLGLKVRGPNYLKDKKKVEAEGVEMELLAVELVDVPPTFHIAPHLPAVVHSAAPFMFVMQVMVPGTPKLSLTAVWALGHDPLGDWAPSTPFARALRRFLEGADAERSTMFKLIPRIEKGSWMVRQAVGQNTPVLLGKKLTTKYFRGPNYIEVDVDVGSSTTASSVVGLVAGAVKGLVIDLAVLLQANEEAHLPEALLGTVRLVHLDLSAAPWLDTDVGAVVAKDRPPPPCALAAGKVVGASPAKGGGWLSRRTASASNIPELSGGSASSEHNGSTRGRSTTGTPKGSPPCSSPAGSMRGRR